MQHINIVELIENNPITRLSKDYNDKLLTKVKSHFTGFEQQMFLTSFYCYLNRDQTHEFVIDLDSVWQWINFSQKQKAKELLEKHFVINKDYVCSSGYVNNEEKKPRGGHNIKKYLLSVKTFKSFCLKAGTNKSNEIHDYYLKLDELIQDTMNEECSELKLQLDQKSKQIEDIEVKTAKEKEQLKENTLLEQFPLNTQCIYIGVIDNKTLGNPGSKMYHETVIKFGQSNNLSERVKAHKKTYENFRLYAAFKVKNKIEIENCIKKHPALKPRMRILTIENMAYREIIALNDEFTLEKVEQYIKDIIKENEYNLENYNLLLKKNDELNGEIDRLNGLLTEKHQLAEKTEKRLNKLEHENGVTEDVKGKIASHFALCKYGYFIYAYQCEDMRFVCSITRQKDYDTLHQNLKDLYPSGKMVYHQKCSYPLTERNLMFILKQNSVSLGQNKFECSEDNVRKSIDASVKLEEILMEKSKDADTLLDYLANNPNTREEEGEEADPEIPTVRKAKRSIDKINIDTGEVLATYDSIEAAGRSLGLTTGTAVGTALRENRSCKGFIWRYTGVSKEQQFSEQPVIKICCKNGEKTCFKNMADAAKDCKISAPALRRRILTDVHVNNYHWIFDPNASHYCST